MTSPRLVWILLSGLALPVSVADGATGEGADSAVPGPGAALRLQEMVTERLVGSGSDAPALQPLENPYAAWPGETLLISVRFATGDAPVPPGAMLVLTVPDGLRYLPGSATGPGTRVFVSRDGGQSFEPDGAEAGEGPPGGTRLRWEFPRPLDAGVTGYLRYRVLRVPPPVPPPALVGLPDAAGADEAADANAEVVTADNLEDAPAIPAEPAAEPVGIPAAVDRP